MPVFLTEDNATAGVPVDYVVYLGDEPVDPAELVWTGAPTDGSLSIDPDLDSTMIISNKAQIVNLTFTSPAGVGHLKITFAAAVLKIARA